MTEYTFTLTLAGIALTDDDLDILYTVGCDDAAFSVEHDGTVHGLFDRGAPSQEDAVLGAIRDIQKADIGARVLRVTADDDLVTASEVAERMGRSRASIRLLSRGDRGPGGFPAPAARASSPNPLWCWTEVEDWFESFDAEAVPPHGPRLSPEFLAEVNDYLDIQEQHRRSPDAPWRPKLQDLLSV